MILIIEKNDLFRRIKSVHFFVLLFSLLVFCFVFFWRGSGILRVIQYIVKMKKKREILSNFWLSRK